MDEEGRPAFIDEKQVINWKKDGQWITLEGRADEIAFGAGGELYKTDHGTFTV